jgi:HK97 family phage portal protein
VVRDSENNESTYTVQSGKPHEILHIKGMGDNGTIGFSVIEVGSQSIGTAISAEKNVGAFYRHGGRLPYVLESDGYYGKREEFEQFRSDWEAVYDLPHRAPILERGLKYKQIGISAKDSQLLETRLFSIHEICRWFGVPPHLVGDLSRATFNNIEQLALEFAKLTLNAWLVRWEQELWRCVLTDEEKKQGYMWRHNLNALLRGDFASRMAGYATMLQNGIASQDEIRNLEDWNPIPEGRGEGYHVQLNMQTLPPDGGDLQPPKGAAPGDTAPSGTQAEQPAPPAQGPPPKTPQKPNGKFHDHEVIQ